MAVMPYGDPIDYFRGNNHIKLIMQRVRYHKYDANYRNNKKQWQDLPGNKLFPSGVVERKYEPCDGNS
jgi:hypothetical protein